MNLIQTPFGFASTAAEVAAGIDLTGRRAVVTGPSSGLGIETVDHRTGTLHGVASYALDPANVQHLWALSETLLAAA